MATESQTRNLDLTYSFGGTRESPLVRDTVHFVYDPKAFSCLQEALLYRTEMLLQKLCTTFDGALAALEDESSSPDVRLRALDVMVATVIFTTKNILMQSPSVHYALMFSRVQQVFAKKSLIRDLFGDAIASSTFDLLQESWQNLRAIDASFGDDGTEEKTK